jgi:hypothetical protein
MRSPSEWARDERIEGARHWLSRYQPFITTVLAIALIAIFLPGRSQQTATEGVSSELAGGLPEGTATDVTPSDVADAPAATGGSVAAQAPVNPNVLSFEEAKKQGVELVANCDQSTGRVRIPSRFAAPCTQKHTGRNSGATWQGVTDKEITVAYYETTGDPASEAILTAADANDSDEEVRQQATDWVNFFSAHYNLWGRKIKLVFVRPSGDATDDAAGKADAIKIATQIKAFAAVNSPNNTFVNELVARKVMCFCTVSLPIDTYIKWAPYVWSTLLASSQGYIHRAEYIGGRLARKKAQWAYDDISPTQDFKSQNRKFGFLYYETTDFAYKSGVEFFIKYMKERYGITFTAISAYNGYPDVAATQEQARPIIQKFKEAGVNSLICSCDPFAPIFFTQEATRQLYGPEWIITGSALTDTSFFGRLYDQDQWAHAFGISYLAARLPEEFGDAYRLHQWQYNRPPSAPAGYGVQYAPISIMFNGFHLAGPSLTPDTFRAGMYAQPIQGRGGITTIARAYGDKGFWPWKEDPVAYEDATEIWWDRNAEGEDDIGRDGRGLYRYVAMGKRYMPGEWPKTTPLAFNTKDTVTIYSKPPAVDQWPCYPSPATKKNDLC